MKKQISSFDNDPAHKNDFENQNIHYIWYFYNGTLNSSLWNRESSVQRICFW